MGDDAWPTGSALGKLISWSVSNLCEIVYNLLLKDRGIGNLVQISDVSATS